MPVPALVVLGAIGLVAVLVAVLLRMERRRLAARDADLARDAAQRGWRYESRRIRGKLTARWQGPGFTASGPGGSWTAEVNEQRRRKGATLHYCRWWNGPADAQPPAAGPVILLMALGDELAAPFTVAPGGGALASTLAGVGGGALRIALAMALDFRFGPSASLSAFPLQRVDPDRPIIDGYAVLSDDPAAAAARLTPGFVAAVGQALPAALWDDGPIRRPWVSLAGDRVAVAGVSRREPRAIDVAALVQAGGLLAQHRG